MGAGIITMAEVAAPSAPTTGKQNHYFDSTDKRFKAQDANGVLRTLDQRYNFNVLRNGGLWFAQRQAFGTLTTYSNTTGRSITADGWGVTNENASIQYIRSDTLGAAEAGISSRNYGTWSKTTALGKIVISQAIGGREGEHLRGRTVRFQVWLKASSNKTIRIGVVNHTGTENTIAATFISAFGANTVDPTVGTNLAYLVPKANVSGDNCTAGATSFSCAVTTGWQRFGGVVDVPTSAINLIVVVFTDSQFAIADSFSMTQASLTDGYEIQDFAPHSWSEELMRVQRYYAKSFGIDSNPIQNFGVNNSEMRGIAGKAGAVANACYIPIRFPMPMIKTPTLTLYNPAAANALVRDITLAADMGATTSVGADNLSFYVNATGVAATAVGDLAAIHYSADAEI